ncbi:MAG TPA: AsmA family protein [Steroidobacteraceae bacterium]|jgi:AsmA protein|nr:AsmA family protein [Steroidobacteraceae bacterium]
MTRLRFLGVLAVGIAVLLGAALIVVALSVNPNNYKGQIAAAVKQSTGRELQLPGDIKLSVFPWVALELGAASLGNPPGFGDEPFLSLTHASVRVKLLPLLRKRLEVGRIEIDGLDLRLRKDAQGRGNWQSTAPQAAAKADLDHTAETNDWRLLSNIRVRQGRVSYEGASIENLNFESGSVTGQHIPVSLSFAARTASGEQLSLKGKFDLGQDGTQQMLIDAVNLGGTFSMANERPVDWDLATPAIALSVAQQTVSIPAFSMSCAGAHLTGSARGTKILDGLGVTGSLTLAALVPREIAPRLGVALPPTRDPKAFTQLAASTDFSYGAQGVELNHLQAHLDDTQLQGSIKLLTAENNALRFDLSVDQIDLDRYRAPENAAVPARRAAAKDAGDFKPLDAGGTLTVKAAQVARLDFTNLRVTLAAKDRVMRLDPIEAQLDGGRYSGDITLDSRGATPNLSLDEHLSGVDMARLLANTAGKDRLSGRATLNLKATARGETLDAMLKTLSGHLDANLADGAFEGIDVGYELDLAQALINRSPAPTGQSTGHTPFQAFKISAQITNGVAETHDLTIASQALKVAGQGNANLASKAIDFRLLASLTTAPARNTDIPLKVTGTYAAPSVRPDIEAAAKDQLKQKLEDVLKKNGLKGLFTK